MMGGRQLLTLNDECADEGKQVAIHELMHAFGKNSSQNTSNILYSMYFTSSGIHHEHMRVDRDKYITINETAISEVSQYRVQRKAQAQMLRDWFDFKSIMLYNPIQNIMKSKIPGQPMLNMTQKPIMSDGDIENLRVLYSCY